MTFPKHGRCANAMTRETVRIGLFCVELNDLSLLSCDMTDSCLNAPCTEKLGAETGAEFGIELAVRDCKPTRADPDLHLREDKETVGTCHEWLLVCVGDPLSGCSVVNLRRSHKTMRRSQNNL